MSTRNVVPATVMFDGDDSGGVDALAPIEQRALEHQLRAIYARRHFLRNELPAGEAHDEIHASVAVNVTLLRGEHATLIRGDANILADAIASFGAPRFCGRPFGSSRNASTAPVGMAEAPTMTPASLMSFATLQLPSCWN